MTASARVRTYAAGFAGSSDLAVAGTLAGWVGRWQGVGFSYGGRNGLIVRRCQVIRQLPVGLGEPTTGLAVISTSTGIVVRLLVDTSRTGSSQTEALGWLDQETVLLTTGTPTSLVLLAWRIDSGVLKLVSVANRGARVAFADLAEAVVEPVSEISPNAVASVSARSSAAPSPSASG